MKFFAEHPQVADLLVSLGIVVGAYVAARLLSFLFGRVLARAAERSATRLDDQLLAALKRPVTYALFLLGAYAAVYRLRDTSPWAARLDTFFFVFGVVIVSLALLRAFGILVSWYTAASRVAAEGGPAREFGPLLSKLGKVFIVLTAVIAILQHVGVNVMSLVVSLGVGSLAVGLAAQDTLANMIAGFTLMLDRPFRVGDRIQLATGEVGDVLAIGMRATRIRTLDEVLLVVPNNALVKERVINRTQSLSQLVTRIELAVVDGSDLERVKHILVESALGSPDVDPGRAPAALITRFGDAAVHFLLVFWVRDPNRQGAAVSDIHEAIYRRFEEAGIRRPFPVRKIIYEGPLPAAAGPEV